MFELLVNKLENLLGLSQNPLIKSVIELIIGSLLEELMIINKALLRLNFEPVDFLNQKSD